jgi:hypothetical protein
MHELLVCLLHRQVADALLQQRRVDLEVEQTLMDQYQLDWLVGSEILRPFLEANLRRRATARLKWRRVRAELWTECNDVQQTLVIREAESDLLATLSCCRLPGR